MISAAWSGAGAEGISPWLARGSDHSAPASGRPENLPPGPKDGRTPAPPGSSPPSDYASRTTQEGEDLNSDEQQEVQKLRQRDQEVRRHEQAHLAAAGGLAVSGAQFEMKKGPDGRMYAVGGEVQIDTSREKTPEKNLEKAQKIQRAALAPANPSAQDRRVAAEARRMEMEAQMELSRQRQGGGQEGETDGSVPDVQATNQAYQNQESSAGYLIDRTA